MSVNESKFSEFKNEANEVISDVKINVNLLKRKKNAEIRRDYMKKLRSNFEMTEVQKALHEAIDENSPENEINEMVAFHRYELQKLHVIQENNFDNDKMTLLALNLLKTDNTTL
jgi:hypothetical protein